MDIKYTTESYSKYLLYLDVPYRQSISHFKLGLSGNRLGLTKCQKIEHLVLGILKCLPIIGLIATAVDTFVHRRLQNVTTNQPNKTDRYTIKKIQKLVNELLQKLEAGDQTAIKATVLNTLNEAEKIYRKNSHINKDQKLQLDDYLEKIERIRQLAKGRTNWSASDFEKVTSEKKRLRKQSVDDINSAKFLKLIYYSLHDSELLSINDVKKFKKVETSDDFSSELFFSEKLHEFYRDSKDLDDNEKLICEKVAKALEFCKNVQWIQHKYTHLKTTHNGKTWYPANTGALFQSTLTELKPGEEIAITGVHQDDDPSSHCILFVFGKLESGHIYCRKYNTGWGSSNDYSDITKSFVEQSVFTLNSLLTDEFASILTEEILNFSGGQNAPSGGLEVFGKFKNFRMKNEIAQTLIKNCPKCPPSVRNQVVSNCDIASKIAYLKQAMGEALFGKFKSYLIEKFPGHEPCESKKPRTNKRSVLAAVRQNPEDFEYASDKLRSDKNFVLKVIKDKPLAFKVCWKMFRENKDFILEAVKHNPEVFKYAPDDFRKDKAFIAQIGKQNPLALQYALEAKGD